VGGEALTVVEVERGGRAGAAGGLIGHALRVS
jgi:hypothetical protein